MEKLGPFENNPMIAIGVSGGADSVCLCLLVDEWVRQREGRAIALTVNHGLRAEALSEAEQVAEWMDNAGIEHHLLTWEDNKPETAIQERARIARYELLETWCQVNGVLHLAMAHNRDDQNETYLMRLSHGSGPNGLAGMATIVEKPHVRVIRPLLTVPRRRLERTLDSRKHGWVDDPTNQSECFERIRVRRAFEGMKASDVSASSIAAKMRAYAIQRHDLEWLTAGAIARTIRFHAAGYATISVSALRELNGTVIRRTISRLVRTMGGLAYEPKMSAVDSVLEAVEATSERSPVNRTLGRCRIVALTGDRLLICRENRHLPKPRRIEKPETIWWDNRLRIEVQPNTDEQGSALVLKALGERGWKTLPRPIKDVVRTQVPAPARYSLPAIYKDSRPTGIVGVPNAPTMHDETTRCPHVAARFFTSNPVLSAVFPLV